MAKPETPAEEEFIQFLDEYCNVLPEQEHIGADEEQLRRAFVKYTTDELSGFVLVYMKALIKFSGIIQKAKNGEIRQAWGYHFPDVAKEIVEFGRRIKEAHELRLH